MVSAKSVGIPTTFALLIGLTAVWLKYRDNQYNKLNEATPLWQAVDMDWSLDKVSDLGYPLCYRPQIYRNALKFPNNSACVDDDHCMSYIKNRLLDKFGERNIPLFSAERFNGHYQTKYAVLSDFLLNPSKYAAYNVEGFTRVGNVEEYTEFLGFEEGLNDYGRLREMGKNGERGQYTHAGTTFYMIDNTPLHLEWGTNFYIMLGGRKRWLLVHPKYYDTCECDMGGRGLHGHCHLNKIKDKLNGTVDIDLYKELLVNELHIPPEYMIDITLNPGDVLASCDLWLHSTKKLDDFGVALSLRMVQPWMTRPFQSATILGFIRSMWTGLWSKWYDPHLHSFAELYKQDILENDPRYDDPETFTCKNR